MSTLTNGVISQILGPVVDVFFEDGNIPPIQAALKLTNPQISDKEDNLVLEVAQHLGENMVRAISMDTTDGLKRGQPVKNTGAAITVPVGPKTLGRILNVVGEPIDQQGPVEAENSAPIHKKPPEF